jgi:hypothetical protein
MASNEEDLQPTRRSVRDRPALIKYILLILLILLLLGQLAGGEVTRLAEPNLAAWIILLIKLILIGLLVQLIRVQRDLRCEITAPKGCVKEQSDMVNGLLFVKVMGTATGAAFGHYTIDVNQGGDPPIPDIVRYPGGGASGGVPVVDGELGRIDTMSLVDGAYTVTLTVYPAGAGSPKVCVVTFNLLKAMVLMDKVGAIQAVSMAPIADNPNPLDPDAELRKDNAASPPPSDYRLVSIGGNLTIDGMAYIYGCSGRRITKYEIRHAKVTAPGTEPSQPPTLSPIPAVWPIGNQIVQVEYSLPDHYMPWTRLGPGPTNLIRKWGTFTWGGTFHYLKEGKWHSDSVGSGRYSLLLTAEDSIGATFHDIQHIWLDNLPVYAKITGIHNVDPCAELQLDQFVNMNMEVLGIAWDRLIDTAFPDTPPNDNFDRYRLKLFKQGGGDYEIGTFTDRVIHPFRKDGGYPTDATAAGEAGTLAAFDIATVLDAANPGSVPGVSIPRGEGCAYYLRLDVWDHSRLNDDSTVHHAHDIWPFCIVNNLRTGRGTP